MANKSYKQLYEELKAQQTPTISEEEMFALKAVAYGCNTNKALSGVAGYTDALITVYKLIERLEG